MFYWRKVEGRWFRTERLPKGGYMISSGIRSDADAEYLSHAMRCCHRLTDDPNYDPRNPE